MRRNIFISTKIFAICFFLFVFLVCCGFTSDGKLFEVNWDKTYNATIERVTDGNTVWISFEYEMPPRSDEYECVRLIGVDSRGNYEKNAMEYLERLCGEEVRIELDKAIKPPRDRNGHLMAYVWYGGELLNRTLIRRGCAYYDDKIKFDSKRMRILKDEEAEAKRERRGLWFERNAYVR